MRLLEQLKKLDKLYAHPVIKIPAGGKNKAAGSDLKSYLKKLELKLDLIRQVLCR